MILSKIRSVNEGEGTSASAFRLQFGAKPYMMGEMASDRIVLECRSTEWNHVRHKQIYTPNELDYDFLFTSPPWMVYPTPSRATLGSYTSQRDAGKMCLFRSYHDRCTTLPG